MLANLRSFWGELKRRRVIRVAIVYAVVGVAVIEAADLITPRLQIPEWTVALLVVLIVLGFPIALVLAWAFELTPEGVRRDEARGPEGEAAEEEAPTAVAVSEPPDVRKSIAVLPFVDMSPEHDQEYFSDGMSEELIDALTKLEGLRVAARTSAFAFKGASQTIQMIGETLKVETVLEGSVRKAGNRLRITAQLVNVADGYHLWSEQYDRELDDIFAIQSDISSNIVAVLKVKLVGERPGPAGALPAGDARSYELYLKGRYQWNKRTEAGLKKAIEYFERAIEGDPGQAPAYAGLADSYALLGIYGAAPPDEVMPKARQAALKALEIDENLAEAYTSLACVRAMYDWEWEAAGRDFERAIEINPDYPTSHQWYALNYLTPLGRFEEAIREIRLAQSLDPLSLVINASVGLELYLAGEYDAALNAFRETLEIDADFALAHFFLGRAYVRKSMYAEAIATLEKAVTLADGSAETRAALGHAYGAAGRRDEARAVLEGLVERAEREYVSPVLIAQVFIGLDEHWEAIDWLEKAVESRSADLVWLKVRPIYDVLRMDPRFTALIERLGLT